jgi:membrane protease YdiL (CAAX protease family)
MKVILKSLLITVIALLVILLSNIVAVELIGIPALIGILQFIICLAAIFILSRRKLSQYGFRGARSVSYPVLLLWVFLIHLLLWLSLRILGIDEGEHPLQEHGLFYIITQALILAPLTEELIFRGLVQSYLKPYKQKGFRVINIFLSYPVLFATLLFTLSHLPMVLRNMGLFGGMPVLLSALLYGLLLGYFREKHDSLIPPIIGHFAANLLAFLSLLLFG